MIINNSNNKKEEYAKSICFFLSELLRTHKISLRRAAEIGQKVLVHLNLIDSEQDFLRLVKELSMDFEELFQLNQIALARVEASQRQQLEKVIREFVISIMPSDVPLALEVLRAAVDERVALPQLCAKFPQLQEFIHPKP